MVASAEVPGGVATSLLALPWRIEGTRPPLRLPPPALGAHTREFRERFRGG
jgi:crotonobetainyl-CoA:carnitine CoA-transferase CaiB-like acyl-CoA transferase